MAGRVDIKTFWNKDEVRTDGTRLGDALVEMYSPTRRQLVEDLQNLARVISGSYDDLEGGMIVIVRQRRKQEKK